MSHINVGLIVTDVFVSEFILEYIKVGMEDIESTFSFMIHSQSKDHNP